MITVIIPCYNAARYIAEAIASVKAQTCDKWKCVIVDDGSNDGSGAIIDREVASDKRFIVFHTENRGVAAARNLAIEVAGGGYILPFDADDRLKPFAIERFTKTWDEHPEASLLVPQIVRFGEVFRPQVQERVWRGYEDLKNVCTPTNSSCFRWEDWDRVGGYRHETMYEDWEFWLRLLYHNDNVVNIPEVLVEYRVHGDSRFHVAVKRHAEEIRLIKRLNPEIYNIPMDKEILVVIPYFAGGAQGNELELAVTGWRKFFLNPHHLVVIGDHHPIVDTGDDITFIPCPRIEPIPGQYLPHIDHVHKFRKVHEAFPDTEGFIYTCDDIYGTADFTMVDVMQPKYPERGFDFQPFDWKRERDWYSDKGKTGELCDKEGLPRRNWVCHLPVYYEWDKLLAIYDKYDCDHVSYIVENIYFNVEYPGDPHAVNCLEYRDEVKTSYPAIRRIGSVKWITNANSGWSEELENILRKHYQ